ncbi:alpha/beta hydrolase family protein [Flammeovirga kamogawensis]|uniref:Prolyl oligopeptidase family serine peptidase n=1 Tax=Flammeovirga kamogawensis TaxID=373891 RepID=A0ABX8H2B9_9BACT|nr:prolyl oligopeptidase family serine peptidase [Flammeovirga kamogawensis]MBB6463588.1 dipeptidyl aminopeptidase/acylaminoacyl peptidase [Flammeovirga kamogawensis]QWG09814.1 prolyl oligopeptidase family serine peptidase [Flammeovirga kamogawensis]TRX65322.1 prolyl oligopeptidase family serine peptidase [Flammeovirga kamogawensis]
MKTIQRLSIFIGTILLIICLFFGFKIGKVYYKAFSIQFDLMNTSLDNEITSIDYQKGKKLKNGEILSKVKLDITTLPPIWNKVSENNVLLEKYAHLARINFYAIVYKSDALLVNGIVAAPKKKGNFPVIIFNRGGNKEVGVMSKAKILFSLIGISELVNQDYIVMGSCYREEDEFGGEDINDVLHLMEASKGITNADPKRIGMLGWSRGGMMTYLALQKSDAIKTAVIGNGPSDLVSLIKERPEMESKVFIPLIPNYLNNKEKELEKRSAINWVNELNKNSSLLLLCGTKDERVNPNQVKNIAKKLSAINYNFEYKELETDHHFTGKANELNKILMDWFKEKL